MSPKQYNKWLITIKVNKFLDGFEYSEALLNNNLLTNRICYSTKNNLIIKGTVFYNWNINIYKNDITNLFREISCENLEVLINYTIIE